MKSCLCSSGQLYLLQINLGPKHHIAMGEVYISLCVYDANESDIFAINNTKLFLHYHEVVRC